MQPQRNRLSNQYLVFSLKKTMNVHQNKKEKETEIEKAFDKIFLKGINSYHYLS